MATGSQNMTTYLAKQIIGSNAAANPAGALLQSGTGRADDNATGDTWIFLNTINSATNPWGIFNSQVDNKIKIIGHGTDACWVNMDTGDVHIAGKLGIGYNPETNQNTYKLYVNGSSYFTDHMYIERDNSAHIYLINKNWTKGTNPSSQTYSAIEYNDTNNSNVALLEATLDTSGNSRFNIYLVPNVASSTSWSGIVLQKTNENVLTVNIAGTTTVSGTVHANGGYLKSTANGNTVTIGSQNTEWCHIQNSEDRPFLFNNTIQMESGKVIGSADTNYRPFQLYLGRYTTTASNELNAANPLIEFSNSDRSQYCQLMYDDHDSLCAPDSLTLVGNQNGINFICKNGPIWIQGGSNAGSNVNRLNTISGMPGNMQYNQGCRGTQIFANGIAFADPYNGNSNNDAGWIRHLETTGNSGILEIAVGDDGNEIIAARQYKTDNTINRELTLLDASGNTTFPGKVTATGGYADRTNGTATYLNYGASGLAASAITWLTCWNGYELRAISKAETMAAVRGAASGSWAISVTGNSNTANYQNCVASNEIRYARNGNMTSAADLWQGWAFAEGKVAVINGWRFGNGNGGLAPIYGSKVYNAVWNDFAEYRISDITEGGRVLVSDGKGHLVLSTERLQSSARVVSDTFGCSVGMSDSAKTPIGVAGRVLVYPYQPRENYKVGDALCTAPNGTADIMTREEIIQYPDRIIGIVDEVPYYEVWDQVHTNKKDDGEVGEQNHTNIEVKGRIWIYVK